MRHWLCSFLLLTLCSCGTAAQHEYHRIDSELRATSQKKIDCSEEARSDPVLAPLWKKLPRKVDGTPTLKMLNDTSLATDEDVTLIFRFQDATQRCRNLALDGANRAHPAFAALVAKAFSDGADNVLQLVNKKITWGEYHKKSQALKTEILREWQETARRVTVDLQEHHRVEIEERQRAYAQYQKMLYRQQVFNTHIARENPSCNRQFPATCVNTPIKPTYPPLKVVPPIPLQSQSMTSSQKIFTDAYGNTLGYARRFGSTTTYTDQYGNLLGYGRTNGGVTTYTDQYGNLLGRAQ